MLYVIVAVRSKLGYGLVIGENTMFISGLKRSADSISWYDDLPQNVVYLVKFIRSIQSPSLNPLK